MADFNNTVPFMQQQRPPFSVAPMNFATEAEALSATTPAGPIPLVIWDKDKRSVYIKSSDAIGRPVTTILDYTVRGEEPETQPEPDYVTKQAFTDFRKEFDQMSNKLDSLLAYQQNRGGKNNRQQGGKQNNE
jgi:hypothetical protein